MQRAPCLEILDTVGSRVYVSCGSWQAQTRRGPDRPSRAGCDFSRLANVTLDPVSVSDSLPGVSAVDCPVIALSPGREETCAATYTTTQADVDNGSITNTGTASGIAPDGTPATDVSTLVLPADPHPAITLAKSGSVIDFASAGTPITFTYTVRNAGNVTLHGVDVTDSLTGLSFVSCPVTVLGPGDDETCTAT